MNATDRFSLDQKTAVVTGAARGIGRGIAIALAQHGADVVLIDRQPESAVVGMHDEIRSLGRRAWYFHQDLAQTVALSGLAERIRARCGS